MWKSLLFLVPCLTVFVTPMYADSNDKPIPGKQVAQTLKLEDKDGEAQSISYWLYLPKDYQPSGEKLPLMLFLHGAGERGENLELVKKHGPPKQADSEDLPFIVISPQCPKGIWWNAESSLNKLTQLLDHATKQFNVDESRVYCTGLSMGGYGTWSLVAQQHNRFAAAVPICGGGDPAKAAQLAKTPIWAFHGDADSVVPLTRSEEMVDAIEKEKGDVKLTVYPGVSHDSWTETYNNPKVYKWLLSHSLK